MYRYTCREGSVDRTSNETSDGNNLPHILSFEILCCMYYVVEIAVFGRELGLTVLKVQKLFSLFTW